MSGTSADGVDVAIVAITGVGLDMQAKLIRHHHRPYNESLRSEIFAFRAGDQVRKDFFPRLARMGREISLTYAAAVIEALSAANMTAIDLAAVAAHGQPLFHDPPDTIQWFDPSLVAAEVGCAVVSDFRRADLAAGGQGAPLVPFADYILFRHPTRNRMLLNLGGIANITFIPAGASPEQVIAFDTGPGNCVLDHLCRKHGVDEGFDRDGKLSRQGTVHDPVAALAIRGWRLWAKRPPKSADIPEMIEAFEQALVVAGALPSLADQLATACRMTADGIHLNLHHLHAEPDEIIASGGGVENPRLIDEILTGAKFSFWRADEFGVPADAKEAIAFALLGAATLDGVPSNVPSATGARRAVVLGSITPKP